MTSQTLAEKLLSRAAGRKVRAGDIAVVRPDFAIGSADAVATALELLARLDGGTAQAPFDARRLAVAFDRPDAIDTGPADAARNAVRDYASRHGLTVFETGQRTGHQIVFETGQALPGQLSVGSDPQVAGYGALNAFATSIGAADLAGVMYCGQLWLRVPASVRVELLGQLRPGVSARDLALAIVGRLGPDLSGQRALEFGGSGIARLDVEDRIVLAGIAADTGAMAGLFRCDQRTREYLALRIGARNAAALVSETPDPAARYVEMITVDLDRVEPMLALPDALDRVVPIATAPPTPIDTVHLGSCTGCRLKDYLEALAVLREGGSLGDGVRLIVTAATERVRTELEARGMLAEFMRLGAEVRTDGCAGCEGQGLDGRRIASTAHCRGEGRCLDTDARVYLASPAECARAAVTGRLGGSMDLVR